MNGLESYSPLAQSKCDYYRQKIAEHTPPVTESDELIVRTYQRFLIRDRSLQYNLELVKMIEKMHMSITTDNFGMPDSFSNNSDALDLNEFKALLDENSE
ncbi:MAG: hypothetical protein KME56_15895 [Candidatus Thiodiazotropha sp. (ex Ctena orbiculata)]|uniref:Uncharacterized protein n=1 Tax=Candidatus Thiodiazotropha taylori TaxID=2792791 RepID=A0A944MDE3_9GAMM|nr:hypothetical protein [Candidatus Thiodiazotropha taylori]PUB81573.1 MAG: hypothetical protein DBP00_18865 [gamma proteobacterium symbiont of Ctena orbiculata]MBT2990609.1 hypothetical protein [Candidatus Thiodiazotropha taylori]MBT2998095.1 hypothetical protein [Candidatus Thiodiazotropha taylori]MBT3002394.1 hypothetical protein [Candidatus Thiodiazotropha taylori]